MLIKPFFSIIGVRLYHETDEGDLYVLVFNTQDELIRVKPAMEEDYIIFCTNRNSAREQIKCFDKGDFIIDDSEYTVIDINNATLFLQNPSEFDFVHSISDILNVFRDFLYFKNVKIPNKYERIWDSYSSYVINETCDIRDFCKYKSISLYKLRESYFWLLGVIMAQIKIIA